MRKDRILIVDDDKTFRSVTQRLLEEEGLVAETAASADEAMPLLQERHYDLLLSDLVMPGIGGLDFLNHVKTHHPGVPVVMITGFASINSAVEAMKRGAEDYLTKPCGNEELLIKIRRTLEKNRERQELQRLRAEVAQKYTFQNFIGKSPLMHRVFDLISQVAETDATVLINGETGTGKELVAKAIHYNSARRDRPFVGVNCAALAETLLESELFGHERGAFTGAIKQKLGRFELSHKGTLFLDEVVEIPLSTQVKLLRVLQERQLERVGGTEAIRFDIRLISATNRDLAKAISARTFREDLFYRLNVVPIHLPPLRERREDIPLLVASFIQRYATALGKNIEGIAPAAMEFLLRYHWPGNVRELENVIERSVVLCQETQISANHLLLLNQRGEEKVLQEALLQRSSEEEMNQRYARLILEELGGNKKEACRILGINFHTLQRRLGEE
jgi:DNA-binding NtrC family response regulator